MRLDSSRIRAIALLAVMSIALCGCATPRGGRLNAAEKMMWSTCPLVTSKGLGTGFVVTLRDPGPGGSAAPVMVTSLHLLKTIGRKGLTIATRLPGAGGTPIVELIRLEPNRGSDRFYVQSPRDDLGAFALRISMDPTRHVAMPSFIDQNSIPDIGGSPRAGTEVLFLGYPAVLPGTMGAFPILRSGRVASYPIGPPAGHGYFLIDADVYPGDSGGPVFTIDHGGRPILAGVILRRVVSNPRATSHLAIAVEAGAIRETLLLLSAQESGARSAAHP